jgi:hypothetical protein
VRNEKKILNMFRIFTCMDTTTSSTYCRMLCRVLNAGKSELHFVYKDFPASPILRERFLRH